MVSFSAGFADKMRARLRKYEEIDKTETTTKIGVTVEKLDDLASKTVGRNQHVWFSDENGPSPLEYFVSALGSCQCVHYAEHAAAKGVQLGSLKIEVDGHFRVTRPRGLERVEYSVIIQSPDKPSIIRELAEKAASDCYVTQTLKKVCEVRGHLVLNDTDVGAL